MYIKLYKIISEVFMDLLDFNKHVWTYYLQLENDFYKTINYVELSEENDNAYSKEYAKQYLSICSEIDVVCKLLCEKIDSSKKYENITDYAKLLSEYEGLKYTEVFCNYTKQKYIPFDSWDETNSPFWWKNYNSVKHNRMKNENFRKSNQKNVFYSLMALFLLNRHLCKIICAGKIVKDPEIMSNLFSVDGWDVYMKIGNGFVNVLHAGGGMSLLYED